MMTLRNAISNVFITRQIIDFRKKDSMKNEKKSYILALQSNLTYNKSDFLNFSVRTSKRSWKRLGRL